MSSASTKCYVCSGPGNSACGDIYEGHSNHEVDCSAAGLQDDGGCTKYKTMKETAFGFFSTTGKTLAG